MGFWGTHRPRPWHSRQIESIDQLLCNILIFSDNNIGIMGFVAVHSCRLRGALDLSLPLWPGLAWPSIQSVMGTRILPRPPMPMDTIRICSILIARWRWGGRPNDKEDVLRMRKNKNDTKYRFAKTSESHYYYYANVNMHPFYRIDSFQPLC